MNIILRGLVLIICLGVLVSCQGGRGGGGGGGGGRGGGGRFHGGTGGSCKGDGCSSWVIYVSIFGGIGALILLIVGITCYKKHRNNRSVQPNVLFIKNTPTKHSEDEKYDTSMFKSGYWTSRYFQYGKWHGLHRFSLTFDSYSMKITGSGTDDVGTFTMEGLYSPQTSRIGLTKKYQAGTGNLQENLGHQVTIQLTWNASNQFEGKWYVQTSRYNGENKFELKFDASDSFQVYEKV